jgi:hypothetical protein|tara:strand:- start:437 stop:649 length:213 start_codon:yes stop_codon:yes gene_type:complete
MKMIKLALIFNIVVVGWFGIELVEFYGPNRFISEYVTAFVVHDGFLPVLIAVMNSVVIIGLGFNITKKNK